MVSLNSFITRWKGKYADFDHYYGPQCVDLVQYWIKNCGYSAVWGNAKDLYANAPTKNFLKYKKTLTNIPKPGDIIIWGGPPADRRWGHTDIFVKGNLFSFTGFDQNWPPNSTCHLQGHSYRGILGILRPRKLVASKPKPKPATKPPTSAVYYTVKPGDSLSVIAVKFKTSWLKLVTLNKNKYPSLVKNPNAIGIGWKIRVR